MYNHYYLIHTCSTTSNFITTMHSCLHLFGWWQEVVHVFCFSSPFVFCLSSPLICHDVFASCAFCCFSSSLFFSSLLFLPVSIYSCDISILLWTSPACGNKEDVYISSSCLHPITIISSSSKKSTSGNSTHHIQCLGVGRLLVWCNNL